MPGMDADAKHCTTLATREEKEVHDLEALASSLCASHKYGAAEEPLRRALAIRESAIGPYHREMAPALTYLGGVLRAQGNFAQAQPAYERALDIRERVFGLAPGPSLPAP